MDMQQLLQLAKDNSQIAVKKFERKVARDRSDDVPGVSKAAIAKFLEKQRKDKEKILAEEKLAKQRRIQARLNANLGKKNKEKNKPNEKKAPPPQKDLDNIKFKIDKQHKKEPIDNKKKIPDTDYRKEKKVENNLKKDKSQSNFERDHTYKNEHRKVVDRTVLQFEKTTSKITSKSSKSKINPKSSNNTSLSFQELAKLAKTNSQTASKDNDPHKLNLKRVRAERDNKEDLFDPDKNIKTKIKKKDLIQERNIEISQKKLIEKEKYSSKEKSNNRHSEKTHQGAHRHLSEVAKHKKPGLIAETISSTKTVAGNKSSPYPSSEIAGSSKQKRPKYIENNNRGIAAQNKPKGGKTARDVEDDFEREERELLKRRRLFEMQRITGNRNIGEELYDDYDLDDEDDDDDDDFIDDSEANVDTSKYIRNIFGYDRRKYYDDDDDDIDNMEASYSQIEKEEIRSARIARIEDEYEAMKEEEELIRKKKKKKK